MANLTNKDIEDYQKKYDVTRNTAIRKLIEEGEIKQGKEFKIQGKETKEFKLKEKKTK